MLFRSRRGERPACGCESKIPSSIQSSNDAVRPQNAARPKGAARQRLLGYCARGCWPLTGELQRLAVRCIRKRDAEHWINPQPWCQLAFSSTSGSSAPPSIRARSGNGSQKCRRDAPLAPTAGRRPQPSARGVTLEWGRATPQKLWPKANAQGSTMSLTDIEIVLCVCSNN